MKSPMSSPGAMWIRERPPCGDPLAQVPRINRRLADAGRLTVVLITHKLREVIEFAQEVTILREG